MRTKALFGPAGNSDSFKTEGYKHTYQAFAWLAERGLDAYEYQAGNGLTGSEENFKRVGAEAAKHGISLSLHAPYFISLSGIDPEKRLKSLNYIEQSQNAAAAMGANIIVIHTGSAAKITREEAMNLASDTIYKALSELPDLGIRWGLETMGKVNQLGTLDEVLTLCRLDRRLCPVVDFGHINAREIGGYFTTVDDYRRVFDTIGEQLGNDEAMYLHCHFSKIMYTKAGEKKHLTFEDTIYGPPFEPLCEAIAAEGLCPCIICESDGTMAEDATTLKQTYNAFRDNTGG